MQTIKASEFKAKCLHLMDRVNENNEEFIITKNGVPVSRLVPFKVKQETLFASHKNQITSTEAIYSVDAEWEAN